MNKRPFFFALLALALACDPALPTIPRELSTGTAGELTWEPATGGSAHPYANALSSIWVGSEPGATAIGVRFSSIETEWGFDFLIVYDADMNEVVRYDGALGFVETPDIPGDTVYLKLLTDESVTSNGFEVSAFGWR